jgi:hypothetical protein
VAVALCSSWSVALAPLGGSTWIHSFAYGKGAAAIEKGPQAPHAAGRAWVTPVLTYIAYSRGRATPPFHVETTSLLTCITTRETLDIALMHPELVVEVGVDVAQVPLLGKRS